MKFKWHNRIEKMPKVGKDILFIAELGMGPFSYAGQYMGGKDFIDFESHEVIASNRVIAWGYYPKIPKYIRRAYKQWRGEK